MEGKRQRACVLLLLTMVTVDHLEQGRMGRPSGLLVPTAKSRMGKNVVILHKRTFVLLFKIIIYINKLYFYLRYLGIIKANN